MKTLYLFIILLLFLVYSSQGFAQSKNYIGLKGGISIPNLRAGGSDNNPVNTGYSSRTGPDFSVFYESGFSKLFSLSTHLEYSSQGGRKDGFQAFTTPDQYSALFPPGQLPPYLYADYKSEAKINYLILSELAKVNFQLGKQSPVSLYIDAGPFGGLLVSAHQVTSGSSIIYADAKKQQPLSQSAQSFDNKEDIKDQLHKGNFGVEGDLGFALHAGNSKIFIEGGGNYGFLNIQKGIENGKNHIGAATIRLGYAVGLSKMSSALKKSS